MCVKPVTVLPLLKWKQQSFSVKMREDIYYSFCKFFQCLKPLLKQTTSNIALIVFYFDYCYCCVVSAGLVLFSFTRTALGLMLNRQSDFIQSTTVHLMDHEILCGQWKRKELGLSMKATGFDTGNNA
jgi:hypothetical protein